MKLLYESKVPADLRISKEGHVYIGAKLYRDGLPFGYSLHNEAGIVIAERYFSGDGIPVYRFHHHKHPDNLLFLREMYATGDVYGYGPSKIKSVEIFDDIEPSLMIETDCTTFIELLPDNRYLCQENKLPQIYCKSISGETVWKTDIFNLVGGSELYTVVSDNIIGLFTSFFHEVFLYDFDGHCLAHGSQLPLSSYLTYPPIITSSDNGWELEGYLGPDLTPDNYGKIKINRNGTMTELYRVPFRGNFRMAYNKQLIVGVDYNHRRVMCSVTRRDGTQKKPKTIFTKRQGYLTYCGYGVSWITEDAFLYWQTKLTSGEISIYRITGELLFTQTISEEIDNIICDGKHLWVQTESGKGGNKLYKIYKIKYKGKPL